MSIQWYPGHMAKAKRELLKILPQIHVIYEVVDARCPEASRNPMIGKLTARKPRLILLNKSDLADPDTTASWRKHYEAQEYHALTINAQEGKGIEPIIQKTLSLFETEFTTKHFHSVNAMIVGIPNVGKSALINRLSKKRAAKVANRPAVTQRQQWITIDEKISLLDTPGILWPKFEDQEVALKLAACGSIKDTVIHLEDVSFYILRYLLTYYPSRLVERYNVTITDDVVDIMIQIGKKRGCLVKGGDIDYDKTYLAFIHDFKNGKLGQISLERP